MNPLIPALLGGALSALQGTPAEQASQPNSLLRTIPAEARKAEMRPPVGPGIDLNGKMLRLSPGAQIRSAQNLIVLPGQLQSAAYVRYLTDAGGDVTRVWILTVDEARRPETK